MAYLITKGIHVGKGHRARVSCDGRRAYKQCCLQLHAQCFLGSCHLRNPITGNPIAFTTLPPPPHSQKKDNCLFLAHELMHDLTKFPVAIQTRETDSRRFFFREHPEPLTILRRYATAKMGVSQGAATLCEKCQNYTKKKKKKKVPERCVQGCAINNTKKMCL